MRAEAAQAHASHASHTANYLFGEPLLSDLLEEALSKFDESCTAFEANRL